MNSDLLIEIKNEQRLRCLWCNLPLRVVVEVGSEGLIRDLQPGCGCLDMIAKKLKVDLPGWLGKAPIGGHELVRVLDQEISYESNHIQPDFARVALMRRAQKKALEAA